MLEVRKQLVLDKIVQLRDKVQTLFGITIPELDVTFQLRGAKVGVAGKSAGKCYIGFNPTVMLDEAGWEHLFNNTVPHEMAHIVCLLAPRYGKNHCNGWKRVCRMLGGNGEARAALNMDLRTRKERQYAYIATCGKVVTVTQTRHNKILKGATYTLRASGGRITRECQYRQVA